MTGAQLDGGKVLVNSTPVELGTVRELAQKILAARNVGGPDGDYYCDYDVQLQAATFVLLDQLAERTNGVELRVLALLDRLAPLVERAAPLVDQLRPVIDRLAASKWLRRITS